MLASESFDFTICLWNMNVRYAYAPTYGSGIPAVYFPIEYHETIYDGVLVVGDSRVERKEIKQVLANVVCLTESMTTQ